MKYFIIIDCQFIGLIRFFYKIRNEEISKNQHKWNSEFKNQNAHQIIWKEYSILDLEKQVGGKKQIQIFTNPKFNLHFLYVHIKNCNWL